MLWQFGRSFQEEGSGKQCPMPSFFLVLPLLYNGRILDEVRSTWPSSGLGKLVGKLSDSREELLAVHDRAIAMRPLSFDALGIGISTKLLSLTYDGGVVRANDQKIPDPPERLKSHFAGADRLGRWFSRLPQSQVFHMLRVEP